MPHCFWHNVVIVFKAVLQLLLIITCLLVQSCQHNDDKTTINNSQPDLSKAALFNMQLGLGYLKQGDRPRAKKKLLIALKQEPESADINAAMAYYLEQTHELEQAKKYYLKAISLSSNSGAQLNNYGTFLCRQADYRKAVDYFLKAVQDPNYIHTAGAYENAGLCVLSVPDREKAKFYFTSALNQDPSRRESLYELVKLEEQENHSARALELIQQHPDLVLKDKVFLALAKNIASKAGNNELAAEYENTLNKLESVTLSQS